MKNQALFSLKDKSEKLKCRLLQFLFGAFRVTINWWSYNKTPGNGQTEISVATFRNLVLATQVLLHQSKYCAQ